MKSQDERMKQREKRYANDILRKVSIENRDQLFSNIKKGKNETGGVFGGAAP